MTTSTISSKYQIVIPKELRTQLQIRPGQKVRLSLKKNGDITVKTSSVADEMYGALAGRDIWGKDPAKTIRKDRDEWEERQKQLDRLWRK